jgi:hypothetical protein
LIGLAFLVVPYLLWTSGTEGSATAIEDAARAEAHLEMSPDPVTRTLPLRTLLLPLASFSATVERPLFSPTRRPILVDLRPPTAPDEIVDSQATASGPTSASPSIRFVGTIGRGGSMTALVLHGESVAVEELVTGDEIDGWRVADVTSDRLVIERGAEQHAMGILQ